MSHEIEAMILSMGNEGYAHRRAGIVDVAKLAGVSRQTVTRAMNDMPGINEKTKSRVLDAAKTLRYRPSRYGRGLVKKGTPILGLVVYDLTNTFYAEMASSVVEAASRRGWTVLVTEWAHGGDQVLVELAQQVDGIFLSHVDVDDQHLEEIFGSLPLVTFTRPTPREGRGTIDIDFGPGLTDALTHLRKKGRRRIVMFDFSSTSRPSQRGAEFLRLCQSTGMNGIIHLDPARSEPDMEAGRAAVRSFGGRWEPQDAIIAFNDTVAVGVIKELQHENLQVPEDVAVIGIDGLPIGLIVTPELTTLKLDLRDVGNEAVNIVINMATGKLPLRGEGVQRRVQHVLIQRQSA